MKPHDQNSNNLIYAQDGPIAHGPELQGRLQPFTVPFFRFKNAPEPEDCGSGVLVKIGGFFFVLTAGHCVSGTFASIALGVRDYPHRFKFEPLRSGYICSGGRDFGYYEVSKDTVSSIEAGNRIFLSERSIEVLSASEHEAKRDFLALAGYPLQLMQNPGGGTGAALLVYSTTMAGGEHAPASNLTLAVRGAHLEIHVWIPQQDNVHTLANDPTPVTLCTFRGASGGGWWSTHMNRPAWKSTDVKLIGTHVGSGNEIETQDGLRHRFSRVSLVGNHLALIARDYPALRNHINTTWPTVEQYGVDS
ncbi:hypothetical protein [Burkholderia ubonensis]|uniref:hypothetical protein n=1 Tax=Burkholderia ubonensis TaxID=101571 RepID=UPI001054A451|nr:hypothetical protein [Burkholderia ubonensis]